MSRLINPGAGEIFDRLTILRLKVLWKGGNGTDPTHWTTEAAALMVKVQARPLSGHTMDHIIELGAVNGAIWQGEDQLRDLRIRDHDQVYTHVELDRIREIAFRLQALNDRRAQLVTLINTNVGDPDHQEK